METSVLPFDLDDVVERLGTLFETGQRAYWVYPLVAESELVDLAAAEERAKMQGIYGDKVQLIHGQMKAPEKIP